MHVHWNNSFHHHYHHRHRHCRHNESIDEKWIIDWIIEILFHFHGNDKRNHHHRMPLLLLLLLLTHCHRRQQHLNFDLTYVPRGYTYYDKKIRIDRNPIRTALNVCKQLISKKVRTNRHPTHTHTYILIIIEIIFNQQTEFIRQPTFIKLDFNLMYCYSSIAIDTNDAAVARIHTYQFYFHLNIFHNVRFIRCTNPWMIH